MRWSTQLPVDRHPRAERRARSSGKPAVDHGDEIWDRVLEVNLTAPFVLARELGRRMVERGSGKIVFVASLLSFQGGVTVPGYAASKGGIAQLTKALANEWAGKGVNVNAIAPGYIATDNTAALRGATRRARGRSSSASRPADGERRRISPARSSFSPRRHPTTCTAPSFRSTAAGSRDERSCRAGADRGERGRCRACLPGDPGRRPDLRRDHLPRRPGGRGDPPRCRSSRGSRSEQARCSARRSSWLPRPTRARSSPWLLRRTKPWSGPHSGPASPFVPGAATPTEIDRARTLGCRMVKIFPASLLGGPAFISAMAPRLPGSRVRADRRSQRGQPRRLPRLAVRRAPAAGPGSAGRR